MSHVECAFQVERVRQCHDIGGISVHLVTGCGLTRAAVTATIVRDDPIALREEEQHLIVPVIGRQRPAMAEHDGLTFAPVLVEDLDAVFRCNRAHG